MHLKQLLVHLLPSSRESASQNSENAILAEIKKCTEAVNANVIEHTAYIRAAADKKDMDLDKYKDQVRQELKKSAASGILKIHKIQVPFLFPID